MKCSKEAWMLQKFVERERTFEFLAKDDGQFDHAQVQLLGKEVSPSINEVLSNIHAEETWRGVMLEPQTLDGSTMIIKKPRGGIKPNGTNQNVNMGQGRQVDEEH